MKIHKRCVVGMVWLVSFWGNLWAFAQNGELLILSEVEERLAGKLAFARLERNLTEQGYRVHNDPEFTALGRTIAAYSDRSHLDYAFYIIEGDFPPRAFALPGGIICLSRSLLTQVCQTDADRAFIVGHEIAHAALRHYADYQVQDKQQMSLVKQFFEHSAQHPTAEAEAVTAVQQVFLPYMAKVRQLKELEADQFGMLYALRAGYPVEGAQHVLTQLRTLYGEDFRLEEDERLLPNDQEQEEASYPTLSERLNQIEQFRIKAVEVAKLFPLGREALDRGDYREAQLIFETLLSLFPQSRTARVGLGVAYHLQYWDSIPGDDFLLAYPGALELEYMYLLERSPRDVDALQRAIQAYQTVLAAEPGNAYACNNLGVALAEVNRAEEAETTLREALRLSNRDFTRFNLAVVLHQKYRTTQQNALKPEILKLLKTYLNAIPHDQVARRYLQELE